MITWIVLMGCAPVLAAGPGDVSDGLLLWLDAEDPDDDGNSGNNPSDGAAVTTWHDKSGNNFDATVVSSLNSGTYSSSSGELINGKPVIRFTRVNQSSGSVYEVSGVDIRATTNEDVTIFTVYRPKTDSLPNAQHHGLWGQDNGSWDRFFATNHESFGDGINDGLASLGPGSQGALVQDAGEVGSVRLLTAVYNGLVTGGTNGGPTNGSEIYFNGLIITRFTDDTHATAAQTKFFIGWDGDNGVYDGDIAELIVYDKILSCSDFNDVVEYLGNKYNQTFNTIAPGGVACSLRLWLKANAGTNSTTDGASITAWNDQSGSGNNATNSGLTAPVYDTPSVNFNPSIDFSGGNQGLTIADSDDLNTNVSSYPAKSISLVFRTGSDISARQTIYEQGGSRHGLSVYIRNSELYGNVWVSNVNYSSSTSIAANTDYVYTFVYDGTATDWRAYVNGENEFSHLSAPSNIPPHSEDVGIGQTVEDARFDNGTTSGTGDYFSGRIMELDYYNDPLIASDRNRLESYNALKYGITISTNYVISSSSIVWNRTDNSSYHNDVAGIGQDDISVFDQRVSKSVNSDAIVTMATSNDFTSVNSTSTRSGLGDGNFLVWGNNGASVGSWLTNTGLNKFKRLSREWRVQETGTVGGVHVAVDVDDADLDIPAFAGSLYLLYDSDNDGSLTDETAPLVMTNAGGGIWTLSTVNFSDGMEFTFATRYRRRIIITK